MCISLNLVFIPRLNDVNDDDCVSAGGRLFHMRVAATGNARSPTLI